MSRDMSTLPPNSHQNAMRTTILLDAPTYTSPDRSDTEASEYLLSGPGLYEYWQTFLTSGPPTVSVLYPPLPQSAESWDRLSCASTLTIEAPVDPWNLPYGLSHSTYSSLVPRSPFHREPSHDDPCSWSYFSPPIKMEDGLEWADDASQPDHRYSLVTVSPERLSTSIFPYDNAYASPLTPKHELLRVENHEPMPWEQRPKSPEPKGRSAHSTARTRLRRKPASTSNAKYSCSICGKLFRRSSSQKTHMKAHNLLRKKEQTCTITGCEKQFVRKADLTRHHTSVHLKKQFKCIDCEAIFARKDTLRKHIENRHGLSVYTLAQQVNSDIRLSSCDGACSGQVDDAVGMRRTHVHRSFVREIPINEELRAFPEHP